MVWRDGVHLVGTPIWCDARRRRDVCFVSSADRIAAAEHGQLIATPITLALLASHAGHLAVPLRRPFTLGTLRLELIPSGRALGAAALHVDSRGRTVLYAGPVRTTAGRDAAEVRASDAVVVAAPFGEPHHVFAPIDEVAGMLAAWAQAQLALGLTPVAVVDSALDGLEVAARLAGHGLALAASRSLREAAQRLANLEALPELRAPGKDPRVIVRVAADRAAVPPRSISALVSGRAIDGHAGFAAGFAWPFAAGRAQLLAWIEQTRAKDVFVTGACAETIASHLGKRARVARPASPDDAVAGRGIMNRVTIANRRDGGWWWRLPLLAVIWLVLATPLVAGLTVGLTLRRWARDLPAVPDLDAWRAQAHQTSLILAADGTHLAELPFRDGQVVGHRTLVPLEAMPAHLVEAVLAAEDVRFFDHRGVDYRAIARAAWFNYQAGRVVEGASTITQQVARNLLPAEIGTARNLRRKVREALLARMIEKRWTKRDVLETYLDFVFLGESAYGMAAAARAYFAKDVGQLDLAESALLAGLIQAPGRLDPYHHLEAARARRDEVLARMLRAKLIDEATRARAAAAPIELSRARAAYGTIVPWYTEQVRQLIRGALPDEAARGGLVIETAALPALGTELARDAVAHARRWAQQDMAPQVGAMLWDHRTGYVEALLGGTLWGRHAVSSPWGGDQFDRMTQSCRQPGSAFKPIVYGAALDRGAITPGTALRDAPVAEYDETTNVHWKPHSGGRFRGVVLAADAFALSLNAPTIDVFDRVGAGPIVALAKHLGITTDLDEVRPLALGASCVKPIELARVFAIIARHGWAVAPRLAIRVRRGDHVLFDAAVPEDPALDAARRFDRIAATAGADPAERVGADGGQLLDERVAFQLVDLMTGVVERGTAALAGATLGRPAAGKTGTTNSNTDAWFIGFTGRELGAVWIGFDDPVTKLSAQGEGAKAALPLWMQAIRAAEGDRPPAPLPGEPPAAGWSARRSTARAACSRLHTRAGSSCGSGRAPRPPRSSGQPGTSPTDFGRTSREF